MRMPSASSSSLSSFLRCWLTFKWNLSSIMKLEKLSHKIISGFLVAAAWVSSATYMALLVRLSSMTSFTYLDIISTMMRM